MIIIIGAFNFSIRYSIKIFFKIKACFSDSEHHFIYVQLLFIISPLIISENISITLQIECYLFSACTVIIFDFIVLSAPVLDLIFTHI